MRQRPLPAKGRGSRRRRRESAPQPEGDRARTPALTRWRARDEQGGEKTKGLPVGRARATWDESVSYDQGGAGERESRCRGGNETKGEGTRGDARGRRRGQEDGREGAREPSETRCNSGGGAGGGEGGIPWALRRRSSRFSPPPTAPRMAVSAGILPAARAASVLRAVTGPAEGRC